MGAQENQIAMRPHSRVRAGRVGIAAASAPVGWERRSRVRAGRV